jgi:hypothetical protein
MCKRSNHSQTIQHLLHHLFSSLPTSSKVVAYSRLTLHAMSLITRLLGYLAVALMVAGAVSAPSPRIREIMAARHPTHALRQRAGVHQFQLGPGPFGPLGPGPLGPGPFGPLGPRPFP